MNAVNGNAAVAHRRNQDSMRRSVSSLARDAIELGELQARLFKLDAAASARDVRTAVVVGAVALVLLLASLPVALLAIAEALVLYAEWPRWVALAVSGGGAIVVCAVMLIVVWAKLRHMLSVWQRSTDELSRNVAWLKSAIKGESQSADPSPSSVNSPSPRSASHG